MIQTIVQAFAGYRYRYNSESGLHDALASVLDSIGQEYEREVRVDSHNRFDFLCSGGIVIEVKVAGSGADLLRQVHRYAQLEIVKGIIVVTNSPWHELPSELNGKAIAVHILSTGGL